MLYCVATAVGPRDFGGRTIKNTWSRRCHLCMLKDLGKTYLDISLFLVVIKCLFSLLIRPFCASHTPDAPLRTHMARSLSLTIFESRNWAVSLHRVHQGSSGLCLWLRGHFLSLLEAEISMIVQIIMFFDQQSWTELFWKLVRCGNYVIYVCVWWVLSRSCGLYLNKTIFRQRKFTLSPWPQVL